MPPRPQLEPVVCACGQPARPRVAKKGPLPSLCADCFKQHRDEDHRRWRERNLEYRRLSAKDWREQNRERALASGEVGVP